MTATITTVAQERIRAGHWLDLGARDLLDNFDEVVTKLTHENRRVAKNALLNVPIIFKYADEGELTEADIPAITELLWWSGKVCPSRNMHMTAVHNTAIISEAWFATMHFPGIG